MYGSEGPLRPTQRFWNLKQLASTPPRSFALPVTSDQEEVNAAAFGNPARGEYAVHLVNNGAARQATLTGLPANVSELHVYVTNKQEGMAYYGTVEVREGKVEFELPAISFVTLMKQEEGTN
ncbi:MAG: hypothetical protein LUF04_13405 [Bacteroides sp.]|nr:hypothetical protein [Bacteroides sp.]